MIHRTDFHYITTWVAAFLGEIWQCVCLFCSFFFTGQMALLFNINFYFDCLIVPGRHEKIYFAQESFYLPGILNEINE